MHEAIIHQAAGGLDAALRSHVDAARRVGARCVVICEPARWAALTQGGTSVQHVRFHDAATTLEHLDDPTTQRERLEALIREDREGLTATEPLYAWGEMVDLLEARHQHGAAVALERTWSEVCAAHTIHLRCGYTFSHVAGNAGVAGIHDVERHHETCTVALERPDVPLDVAAEHARLRRLFEVRIAALEPFAAVGLITAGVVHDAAGPLSYVLGNIEALLEELQDVAPQTRQLATDAASGLEVLREVFSDVRKTSGRREDPTTIALVPILERVLRLHGPRLGNVEVALDVRARPCVQGPSSRLYRLFANLVSNACDAMHARRRHRLEVVVSSEEGSVEVQVTDSGDGLDPAIASRLFEPHLSTRPGGTGLGLMLVKRAVDELGGVVVVEPGPTTGTRVRVRLPVQALS
jgi:C4-dicarboxylate-specific signal transduction histidine kinase